MQRTSGLKELAYGYRDEAEKAFKAEHIEDAIILHKKAIQVLEQLDEPEELLEALVKLGVYHAVSGEDDLAIDGYMSALDLAMKCGDTYSQARILNNVANRLLEIRDFRGARDIFLKALSLAMDERSKKHPNYERLKIVLYLNIVNALVELEQITEAEKYSKLCWEIVNSSKDKESYYSVLIYELRLKARQGKRDYLKEHVGEVIRHFMEDEKTQDFPQHVADMCDLLESIGDYNNWQSVLESFDKYVEAQNSSYFFMVNADLWTKYYKATGDNQNALFSALEYHDYANRYQDETNEKKAKEITTKLNNQITKTKQQEDALINHIDPLTGVGDDTKLHMDYQSLLAELAIAGGTLGVAIVDIDKFHAINEEKGYLEGDKLLREVAEKIKNVVLEYGLVYRLIADKFVLLIAECNDDMLKNIAEDIKKALPVSVCQSYAYMVPETNQDFEVYLKYAQRSLSIAKESGTGEIVIHECSFKDYHKFYSQYRMNLEKAAALEESFREAGSQEDWMMMIEQRRVSNQELFDENQKLIQRYITPILNGTEELNDEIVLALAREIWEMREAGYIEHLVMLEVAEYIEKYLEQSSHAEEHIYMLIVLGEAYGHMNSQDYFDKSYFYYRKLNLYRTYLGQIQKRSLRRTLYYAFLQGGVILAESRETTVAKIIETLHLELEYIEEENVKELLHITEEEITEMVDGFVTHALAASLIHCHVPEPLNNMYKEAWLLISKPYERAVKKAAAEGKPLESIDDRLHAVYYRIQWLLGKITLEQSYEGHKAMFNHIMNMNQDEESTVNAFETTAKFRMMIYYVPELLYMSHEIGWEHERKEKAFLDSLLEGYMIFMNTLPKGGKEAGLTKVLCNSLSRMIRFIPSWVNAFDLLFKTLIERNIDTSIHSRMTCEISKLILEMVYDNNPELLAGTLGFETKEEIEAGRNDIFTYVKRAALIHDVGKIEINEIISQQTRQLTEFEIGNIKRHPEYGAKLVEASQQIQPYIPMILGHHRFYNDKEGYPIDYSYKNHENPLLVNILQLADSLDAATDSVGRSYAKTKSLDEILKEFSHERGVRYNATLVNMMQRDANFQEKLNQILTQGREEICYEIYKEYTI